MRKIRFIPLAFLSFLLAGCHHTPPAAPPAPLSPEQKQCVARCQNLHRYCEHQRKKIYSQCRELAHQQATLNYRAYYADQLAHKKRPNQMKKSFNDFYTTGHCAQQLNCQEEQSLCHRSCDL